MPIEATATSQPLRQVNSRHGIQLMLAGMFLFATADVLAKYLTQYFHPIQIFWFRQFALLMGVLVMLGLRGPTMLRTDRRRLQVTRGVLVVCSSLLFISLCSMFRWQMLWPPVLSPPFS